MPIYAVGDIQGCLQPLKALLSQVNFNPEEDELWCAGDLINRGPESLETLRFLKQLGPACKVVLGNHDLHLLAVAFGDAHFKNGDTLDPILNADDADELLTWLRHQPLIHTEHSYTMVHAGIPFFWSIEQAHQLAQEVSDALIHRPDHYLTHMYGNHPDNWHEGLKGMDRLRCITNYLTRMRYCHQDGSLDMKNKLPPKDNTQDTHPWFELRTNLYPEENIIFGHWASLNGECDHPHLYALDTGCVWGGCLTMMRLFDNTLFQHQC